MPSLFRHSSAAALQICRRLLSNELGEWIGLLVAEFATKTALTDHGLSAVLDEASYPKRLICFFSQYYLLLINFCIF